MRIGRMYKRTYIWIWDQLAKHLQDLNNESKIKQRNNNEWDVLRQNAT